MLPAPLGWVQGAGWCSWLSLWGWSWGLLECCWCSISSHQLPAGAWCHLQTQKTWGLLVQRDPENPGILFSIAPAVQVWLLPFSLFETQRFLALPQGIREEFPVLQVMLMMWRNKIVFHVAEMCLNSPGGERSVSDVYPKCTKISVYNAEVLMLPLVLLPLNDTNFLFPNEPLQISIFQPFFPHQAGADKSSKRISEWFCWEGNHLCQHQLSNYSWFAPAESWWNRGAASN